MPFTEMTFYRSISKYWHCTEIVPHTPSNCCYMWT